LFLLNILVFHLEVEACNREREIEECEIKWCRVV